MIYTRSILSNFKNQSDIPMTHAFGGGLQVPSAVHVTTAVFGTNPTLQSRVAEEPTVETLL